MVGRRNGDYLYDGGMGITTRALGLTLLAFGVGVIFGVEGFSKVSIAIAVGAALFSTIGYLALKKQMLLGFVFLFLVVALGGLRTEFIAPVHDLALDGVVDQKSTIIGVISDEPDQRESSTHLTIKILQVNELSISSDIVLLASVPRYPEYQYGDHVQLKGKIKFPEDFTNDPLRPAFPYVRYLAKDGIGYVMQYPSVTVLDSREGNRIRAALIDFKRLLLDRIGILFPEPGAGLLSGVLLGAKRAIGKDMLDMFRSAGLIHIVVLSGYNMTVVAEGVARMFAFLPVLARTSVGMIFVTLFAIMVGGGATVVRATIMTLLALLARMTGRTADAGRLLFIAGLGMVAQNPAIVCDDPSFQLSFVATLGLIYGAPIIERRVMWIRNISIRSIVSSTIAVQITVLPLLLSLSGNISPYALFANLAVLPTIPLTMAIGALAVVASYIFFPVGTVISWVGTLLLSWVTFVAHFVTILPYGTAQVNAFPMWLTLLLEGGIILFAFAIRHFYFNPLDISQKEKNDNKCDDHNRDSIPSKDLE